MYTVKVEGYTPKERENMNFDIDMVAPSFFSTIGVPILAGREFTPADRLGAPLVCAINETVAKRYFPGQSPIGHHIAFGRDKKMREIVALVKDRKNGNLREETRRYAYAPLLQEENPWGQPSMCERRLLLRALARRFGDKYSSSTRTFQSTT